MSVCSFCHSLISQEASLQILLSSLWLLMVGPVLKPTTHNHHADLRRALQPWAGCTSLPQATGTSPHHIFSVSSIFSPYFCLFRKRLLPLLLLSFSISNLSAQRLFSTPSAHSSIPPSVIPTPGMPSSLLLSARDSCHLGPIRSD